jgi:hypothetical protein
LTITSAFPKFGHKRTLVVKFVFLLGGTVRIGQIGVDGKSIRFEESMLGGVLMIKVRYMK